MRKQLKKIAAVVILLAACLPACAQCALCYESASQAGQRSQQALSRAVIFLLVPPVTMMVGLVGVAFRYGKKRDEEE
jgi:flagellar basal body-associated protein FliL